MYNFRDKFTNVTNGYSFKNVGMIAVLVLALLVVVFIVYYIYIKYLTPKVKEMYKPNREQVPSFAANSSGGGNSNDAEVFLFSADWCPHCKAARPEWDAVKEKYNNQDINGYRVLFRDVNCTTNTAETDKLMDTYSVDGFPTIKLLKNGQIINYEAKITSANLTQFLNTAL